MTLKPLLPNLTTAMILLARQLFPNGIDRTDDYEKVNTIEKLVSYSERRKGRQIVWTGASDATIYGDPEGNIAFRAVHDWIHLAFNLEFTPEDEARVLEIQKELVKGIVKRHPTLFQPSIEQMQELVFKFDGHEAESVCDEINRYMEADLCGIVAYHEEWGFYPKDQRKFVTDLLDDSAKAMATKYEAYKEAA